MKKLRIIPSNLQIREARMPIGAVFRAVKLTYEQAMSFKDNFQTFGDLLAAYGVENQFKTDENYDGYLAVHYSKGRSEVVKLCGMIQKISPESADDYLSENFAKSIRAGCAWEVVGGKAFYVWTFNDCPIARYIKQEQQNGRYRRIKPEAMDATLKQKVVNALLSESKELSLTDEENAILKAYLKEGSHYDEFFVEIK